MESKFGYRLDFLTSVLHKTHKNIAHLLVTGTPWYISNASLYKDLNITTFKELLATTHYEKFHTRLPHKPPIKK